MAPILGVLTGLYNWLACAEMPEQCDAIFVLAGREYRKWFGLRLLEEGWAERLILSVGRYEVRGFAKLALPVAVDLMAAAHIAPQERHFFVTILAGQAEVRKIELAALGTMSEIRGLAEWLNANPQVRSVMVVSSGFHLRRVRLCCRALVKRNVRLMFVAAPDPDQVNGRWWRDPLTLRMVIAELPKLFVYRLFPKRSAGGQDVHTSTAAFIHKMSDCADTSRVSSTAMNLRGKRVQVGQ
jgi:hypothetical protein